MARVSTVGESAALSRELGDFLIEFSIGLQKYAIYPAGHPMLGTTSVDLNRRLEALLKERQSLSLGVARHQLIIEGVATDDSNPVLRELAARLHRHHLGAVKFSQGVTETELNDFLATVAVDAGRLPRPLGLESPEVLTQWPHTRLYPMTFAQLQLIEENPAAAGSDDDQMKASGSGSRSAALWIGLARAALITELGANMDSEDAASTDPAVVAKAIEDHKRDEAYDQVVVGYLLQIAEEVKQKGGRDAAALTKRVSQLVGTLSPEALQRLMQMGGDVRQRRKFVADAAQGDVGGCRGGPRARGGRHLGADDLALDGAHALEDGGARGLGQCGVTDAMPTARCASRSRSSSKDGNSTTRTPMATGWRCRRWRPAAPMFRNVEHSFPLEPERLLMMGLEIETLGDQVFRAADSMAARPDITPLIDLIDNAPAPWMRDTVWRHVATPERLRLQLALDPPPTAVLQRMVARMGAAAVDGLLDALDEATEQATQERVVDLLASVGPPAGPLIMARLPGMRWSHVRLLIALLGKQREWPGGYTPEAFLNHPDPLLRREALRQQLRAPETRDVAIVRALADASEATLRLGLGAAMTSCPRDAAAILRVRADDATISPDLRALGVRALASYKSPETPSVARRARSEDGPTVEAARPRAQVAGTAGRYRRARRTLEGGPRREGGARPRPRERGSRDPGRSDAAREHGMSEPARFLTAFAQSLATMSLYNDGHPQRERTIDSAYDTLLRLQENDPRPRFSFLGQDVIYGEMAMRELGDWDWGARLANAGVQRVEFERGTSRDEFEVFLEEVLARLTLQAVDSAGRSPERRSTIKFGAIGVKGSDDQVRLVEATAMPTAHVTYSLNDEADTVRWLHNEVQVSNELPLAEAESVVRSLSIAMHGDKNIVIPLLQLKEFDQYTTTHSLNVSVLTMALAEYIGLGAKDVRAFGVAGTLARPGQGAHPQGSAHQAGKAERRRMEDHAQASRRWREAHL